MPNQVKRTFVEKKSGFDVEAHNLYLELKNNLGISGLSGVRVVNRYDVAGIDEAEHKLARNTIFAEPNVDDVYDEILPVDAADRIFAMEYLPGQYDQRADSAAQCIQILTQKDRPGVVAAKVYILKGVISEGDFAKIKSYIINPVEAREAVLTKPASLEMVAEVPSDVKIIDGFIAKSPTELKAMSTEMGLAMSEGDLTFCQEYFRDTEKRNPTITEVRLIDTYWSDHCRHTTFLTRVEMVTVEEGKFSRPINTAYSEYLAAREYVYGDKKKDICLMDLAVIGMKELKKRGMIADLDESEEINACSIVVPAEIDGEIQEWLVMFKNETHNHPTEIEPFGGAATCLGGAIRDPLSGRSYVYQAMRVTGSGDPRTKIGDTLPGKLSQRKITTSAAAGYSSYGNQIGLATGQVAEVYDEGFVAKRMEVGAVIGAAPKSNVVRETPVPGDVILLVGGRTGRDGCGGATGSSKEHTEDSLLNCGAEVQKGNPPTERKIQRLFRRSEVSKLIKRCNDFGAGGVSVAIGELTESLVIDLDAVPKKYEGLDGTELAISESQERMAVVVAAKDAQTFSKYAAEENLEVSLVAKVTDDRRLKMLWRGNAIVGLSRAFLDTNGVCQTTMVEVKSPSEKNNYFTVPRDSNGDVKTAWLKVLGNLNVASQKGLGERFDSTIGGATVLMPFGGKYQATPAEGMVAKLPVLAGETVTGTIMTYGYNPQIGKWSPFHGALYAVVEAVAKVAAIGGDFRKIRLSLQEYFEKLGTDAARWGKPFSALLGAYYAQKMFGIPAIGGKDSMSGTFLDLTVPPTLVAFAAVPVDVRQVVSQELKTIGSKVVLLTVKRDEHELPDFSVLANNYTKLQQVIADGKVLATYTVKTGGIAAAISKMAFGNKIGMVFDRTMTNNELFSPNYGAVVLEMLSDVDCAAVFGEGTYEELGHTQERAVITVNGIEITLEQALAAWEKPLEGTFPTQATAALKVKNDAINYVNRNLRRPAVKVAKPRVFIPVFPGTNCEDDSARAFVKAGAIVDMLVIRNLSAAAVEDSITEMARRIDAAQMIMLPGGFSAGDEPEGSAKFIATMFRNAKIKEAVNKLLEQRDGLMLGICNGFQALIKLGLVPYGKIIDEVTPDCPTLTFNNIGRHVSTMVQTKTVSVLSPWLANVEVGDIHSIAVSHGEGRFVATAEEIANLAAKGQIATQYVDFAGIPASDISFNPNGSMAAVEAITSPDGRVLGKMGHSERVGANVSVNIPGEKDQKLFVAGVKYFS
ncbi:MAG: phosphoribosylformylglycinamidine synthase [Firmicutes bacterium]|nr:phosphoribosylformylglycinamidine synthase [Bacillota bacterium]